MIPPSPTSQKATLSHAAARRLVGICICLGAVIGVTYVVPALHAYRPWTASNGYVPFWNLLGRSREDAQETAARARHARLLEAAQVRVRPPPKQTARIARSPVNVFPPYTPRPEDLEAPPVELENAGALEHYFRRLALVELGVANVIARASHWGDSVLGDDELPFAIRSRLQARFGDAGHGFHVLAPFNKGYQHRGVRYRNRGGWASRCEILFQCEPDGRYGFGGTSSRSRGDLRLFFATAEEGFGSRVARFELWYQRFPNAGRVGVFIDGLSAKVIDAGSAEPEDAVESIDVTDGPHEFEVEGLGGGPFRGYGVVLEREGPGVVWDGLAVIGSLTARLGMHRDDHIAWQIARRRSDLLVFMVGGNDLRREPLELGPDSPYTAEYRSVLRRYRSGAPQASCLVMSIVDHGARVGSDTIVSRSIVPRMVEAQRRVAFAEGCGFFDMYRAMGGPGSVARWHAERPALMNPDLNHPTSRGYDLLGALFYRAFMSAYVQFRRGLSGQPVEHWGGTGVASTVDVQSKRDAERTGAPSAAGL